MPFFRRCVFGCVTNGIPLHNFPNPTRFPEHFKLWVELVGEPVENLTPAEIYGKKKVCDLHFTPDDRNRNNRLNALATPVPFPYQKRRSSEHLQNQHGSSSSTMAQTELFQDPELDLHGEYSAISKEQVEESIVPVAKTFTWQNQSEAVCIKTDIEDTADDLSMYLDIKKPTSPPQDVKCNDKMLHEGFHCDECKGEIRGFRYACVQCSDFDVCSACETNRAHAHHYMLRVPQCRPYSEIQMVLATIRRHLMKKLDPITEHDHASDDAMSIKSEIKSESEDDEMTDENPAHDWSNSSNKSTPQKQKDCDNEDHINRVDTNPKEETQSNTQVEEQIDPLSTETATLSHSMQQQQQPNSKQKAPVVVSSTAKKKIFIKLKDLIKVKVDAPSAKKIRVMPAPKNESVVKIQRVLTQKAPLRPTSKLMYIKLPLETLLKDGRKVSVQKLPPSKEIRHSADADNG